MSYYYPAGSNPSDKPGLYGAPPSAAGGPLPASLAYTQPGGPGMTARPVARLPSPHSGLPPAAYSQQMPSAMQYPGPPGAAAAGPPMYQPVSLAYSYGSGFQAATPTYSSSAYPGLAGAPFITTSSAGYPGSAMYGYAPQATPGGPGYPGFPGGPPMQAQLSAYPAVSQAMSPAGQMAYHPGAPPFVRGPLM